MKLIKKRNNSVGWAIAKKIGEIEKMIIFKKSTLTGAFLTCLISENWFLIFINQVGAPGRVPIFVTQKDPDELVHFYRKRTQGKKAGSSVLLKS